MKPVRLNANQKNSVAIRKTQRDYRRKFAGARLPLEAIADQAIELGLPLTRAALNIETLPRI